jgi:hypothetical protein
MPDSSRAAARDTVAVVGCLLLLGVVCGVIWSMVVTPADFTRLHNGAEMSEAELSKQFGADGWYAVISVCAAVLAGVVLTWWRSRDALWTAAMLLLGSLLAAVVMVATGHLLGPPSTRQALAAAKVGAKVPESLGLGVRPVTPVGPYLSGTAMFYLAWPVGVLAGCLAVLLLKVPAAEPADPSEQVEEEPATDHE